LALVQNFFRLWRVRFVFAEVIKQGRARKLVGRLILDRLGVLEGGHLKLTQIAAAELSLDFRQDHLDLPLCSGLGHYLIHATGQGSLLEGFLGVTGNGDDLRLSPMDLVHALPLISDALVDVRPDLFGGCGPVLIGHVAVHEDDVKHVEGLAFHHCFDGLLPVVRGYHLVLQAYVAQIQDYFYSLDVKYLVVHYKHLWEEQLTLCLV